MVFVVELDVGTCGSLHGGTDNWSDFELATFPWNTQPFPPIAEVLEFRMTRGEPGIRPNVWWHNLLRDFVCDAKAYEFFREWLDRDLHVVARARCGRQDLTVVQVVAKLDVADKKRSIRMRGQKAVIDFPHVAMENEQLAAGRIFRQERASLAMFLAGDDVVEAIKQAGLVGFRFDRAWVHRD